MWTNRLTLDQSDQVRAIADRATAADGVAPLNEEAGFALRDDSAEHLLHTDVSEPGDAIARRDSDKSRVTGYLQWNPQHRTTQLVVDPDRRREGIGTELLAALGDRPSLGVWAFADLPAARGFAKANGLTPSRSLLIMDRSLAGSTAPQPPPELALRGYTEADADDLLAVNAAAFVHHPEQGKLDAAGLAARMAEPWFDPSGLILAFDEAGLVGFHWTKRVDTGTGEVYVIGVAPRAQGRGYGRVLLAAGLAHLHQTGTDRVLLYVDSAEEVAVRMYESAGFHVARRDVLYAPNTRSSHDLG